MDKMRLESLQWPLWQPDLWSLSLALTFLGAKAYHFKTYNTSPKRIRCLSSKLTKHGTLTTIATIITKSLKKWTCHNQSSSDCLSLQPVHEKVRNWLISLFPCCCNDKESEKEAKISNNICYVPVVSRPELPSYMAIPVGGIFLFFKQKELHR